MNEASITAALLTRIRHQWPKAVVLKHADKLTYGVPDFSVSYFHWTSWWEVKYAKNRSKHLEPSFKTVDIQEVTCKRLAQQASCLYIIYEDNAGVKSTHIVKPNNLADWRNPEARELSVSGFNHNAVFGAIAAIHLQEGHP